MKFLLWFDGIFYTILLGMVLLFFVRPTTASCKALRLLLVLVASSVVTLKIPLQSAWSQTSAILGCLFRVGLTIFFFTVSVASDGKFIRSVDECQTISSQLMHRVFVSNEKEFGMKIDCPNVLIGFSVCLNSPFISFSNPCRS